jgi:small-conductance mechanosensitive channel
MLEKVKLRFDHEGIKIAFPQRDVHIHQARLSYNPQETPEIRPGGAGMDPEKGPFSIE